MFPSGPMPSCFTTQPSFTRPDDEPEGPSIESQHGNEPDFAPEQNLGNDPIQPDDELTTPLPDEEPNYWADNEPEYNFNDCLQNNSDDDLYWPPNPAPPVTESHELGYSLASNVSAYGKSIEASPFASNGPDNVYSLPANQVRRDSVDNSDRDAIIPMSAERVHAESDYRSPAELTNPHNTSVTEVRWGSGIPVNDASRPLGPSRPDGLALLAQAAAATTGHKNRIPTPRTNYDAEPLSGGHSGENGEVYCVCRKGEEGRMIRCDGCDEWVRSPVLVFNWSSIKMPIISTISVAWE